jgi:RNA polymerase sigma-70 factor, ECF subfamily
MKPYTDFTGYNDETLMSLIAQSQDGALAQLYDRYNRLVFSLAIAIVHDQPTAEEITLDVFMRVWQKAGMYRSDQARVKTWLAHITRNHSIDILRRRAARPEQSTVIWDDEAANSKVHGPDPAESAETRMRRKRIHHALALLPNDQRQAVFLAYFEGYTQSQIAETLKQPLGTIKTRMRLAMQKLRDFLRDENEALDTSVDVPPAYSISKEE